MYLFRKYVLKHKNNKFLFYLNGMLREFYPYGISRGLLKQKLSQASSFDEDYIRYRVNYYNKLSGVIPLSDKAIALADFKLPKRGKDYYMDAAEYTRYFRTDLRAHFLFGDIIHVPDEPTLLKSRPVNGDNANSVILNLEKLRHFTFVKDDIPFKKKLDKLIWRGVVKIDHRIRFMNMYFGHPMCNLGKVNTDGPNSEWLKERIPINGHLKYKFILSIEGNDVATNLKWIMSSNSVPVMTKPKYETWFMEGTLIPDYHYILIKDDYSDLEERLQYYIAHPDETEQIVRNANEYVRQFKNKKREDLLSLLVLEKYFVQTGQMDKISAFEV